MTKLISAPFFINSKAVSEKPLYVAKYNGVVSLFNNSFGFAQH